MLSWLRRQKLWHANNFRIGLAAAVVALGITALVVVVALSRDDNADRSVGVQPTVTSITCRPGETFTTISVGQNDGYTIGAKPDVPAASPSSGLQVRTSPLYGVDDPAVNHRVGHTFAGLPIPISSGELITSVKALEDGYGGGNDTLELTFTDAGGNLLTGGWRRFVGTDSVNASAGLVPNHWGPTNWPSGNTFTVDLAALPNASGPPINLVQQINGHGFVDFLVQDDTSVDYLLLNLCVPPRPSPTASPSATPLSVGTAVPVPTSASPAPTATCAPAGTTAACTPTPAVTSVATSTPTRPPAPTATPGSAPTATPTCTGGPATNC